MKFRLLILSSFLVIGLSQRSYSQISLKDYLDLENPSVSFDTVAASFLSVKVQNGKFGMVNALGNWVVAPVYDKLGNVSSEASKPYKPNWKDGILIVRKQGKYGAINCLGKEIIPCIYLEEPSYANGIFSVKNTAGKYLNLDKNGKVSGNYLIDPGSGLRSVNLSTKYHDSESTHSYALLNKKGDTLFKLKNSRYVFKVLGSSEGMTAFVMYPIIFGGLGQRYGTIGFLNQEGKIAVQPIYSAKYLTGGRGMSAWEYKPAFHEGRALVFKGDTGLYVDQTGKEVIDFSNRPGTVSIYNDFNEQGYTLIYHTFQENNKNVFVKEIIDSAGNTVFKLENGIFGEDGLEFTDITGLEYFFAVEEKGKTLYNSKLEKQFFLARNDEHYKYSFFSYPGDFMTCIIRKDKQSGVAEYTFVNLKGEQLFPYRSTDSYFDPFTNTAISKQGTVLTMTNGTGEVVYSCDSCHLDQSYSLSENKHYQFTQSGVFKIYKGKEVLFINYRGTLIDRFPSYEHVTTSFNNISEEYQKYLSNPEIAEIAIRVKQKELDEIYKQMPWKNKR